MGSLNRTRELKACGLNIKYKRALFNILKSYESLSVCIDLQKVHKDIMSHKKSIHRYKDYALKRCIKGKMIDLINRRLLDPNEDITLIINIDEQTTASNGYYDLSSSIYEEFISGIYNFDYGVFHKPILFGNLKVHVYYKASIHDYLIQASDIIANRIWSSYVYSNPNLRNKTGNHYYLQLPLKCI